MTDTPSILVIGATGKIGSRIVTKLEAGGHAVRSASRRSNPAFSWDDPAGWPAALADADVAFVSFFPDLAAPGAPEAILHLTDLAKAAGLRRLVLLSGRGETNAQRSEEVVRASGLDFTIVRASWFNQNFSEGSLLPFVLGGTVELPTRNSREPFVDADDIADVAVAALLDPRHAGQLYEVTGPRLLTFADATAEIAAVSQRPVAYSDIAPETFHAMLLSEVGRDYADLLTNLCTEVFDGRNESTADGVERALGRKPRDFSDYCRATAATGIWSPER